MAAEPGHRRRSFVEIGVDEVTPVLRVELCGESSLSRRDRRTSPGSDGAQPMLDGPWIDRLCREAGTSAGRPAPTITAIASSRRLRSPTTETPMSLRVVNRQPRQQVRVDLVVPELLFVLAEAKTAKPPADIHRRASHGWQDDRSRAAASPPAPIDAAWGEKLFKLQFDQPSKDRIVIVRDIARLIYSACLARLRTSGRQAPGRNQSALPTLR